MSTTFTLAQPATIGNLGNQVTVSSLQLTGITFSSTPEIAQLGTGELTILLTDPKSGYQEQITYRDSSALDLWLKIGDTVASAVFEKLIADAKIPTGTVQTTPEGTDTNPPAK